VAVDEAGSRPQADPDLVRPTLAARSRRQRVRAYLYLDTSCQLHDRSIRRTTPVLFGLHAIVTLAAAHMLADQPVPAHITSWYQQQRAPFSESIALVRGALWRAEHFSKVGAQMRQ
jgi:hypothetical protein